MAIRRAEALMEEQMEEFFSWYNCVDVMPLIGKLKAEIAEDLQKRLIKKLRELPVDEKCREQLREDIGTAAVKTMNKMLFGLRDGLEQNVFRQCLDSMDDIYQRS